MEEHGSAGCDGNGWRCRRWSHCLEPKENTRPPSSVHRPLSDSLTEARAEPVSHAGSRGGHVANTLRGLTGLENSSSASQDVKRSSLLEATRTQSLWHVFGYKERGNVSREERGHRVIFHKSGDSGNESHEFPQIAIGLASDLRLPTCVEFRPPSSSSPPPPPTTPQKQALCTTHFLCLCGGQGPGRSGLIYENGGAN